MIHSEKAKAIVAFVLTAIGGIATWAVTEYPDNADVQEWGGLALAILTVLATTYGVWKTTNIPATLPAPPVAPAPPAE